MTDVLVMNCSKNYAKSLQLSTSRKNTLQMHCRIGVQGFVSGLGECHIPNASVIFDALFYVLEILEEGFVPLLTLSVKS